MADDDFIYNNEEEAEMAQLHAIHIHMNAVKDVQRAMEAQAARPSLKECDECGDEIPEARRRAIPGVQRCVHCQEVWERDRALHARPGMGDEV
jgi:phage/conjugal plasmid C-4 type zinc finger TraR family protein